MAAVAAQVAAWGRTFPAWRLTQTRAGGLPGTPILTQQFADLHLVVEIAWGSSPTTDPATWVWSDVTADVQQANAVAVTVGRADEASTTQPASCAFTLLNTSGDYSKGPQSRHHPYVRRDTPVRVRVSLNGVWYNRFVGYAVGFKPTWDVTGKFAVASVTAAGSLRRLAQGTDPLFSPMRRFVLAQPSLLAYWPCEDGSQATSFASAITGQPAMTTTSLTPSPAAFSGFLASAPIPALTNEIWTAAVNAPAFPGQVNFFIHVPGGTIANGSRVMSVNLSGTLTRIDVVYGTAFGGSFTLYAYSGPTAVANTAGTPLTGNPNIDNGLLLLSVEWYTSGGNLTVGLAGVDCASGLLLGVSPAFATGYTVVGVSSVVVDPDLAIPGVAVGQLYVQSVASGANLMPGSAANAFTAFVGPFPEPATDRLTRMCAEQGESISIVGSAVADASTMGPQPIDAFMNILRECETRDLGVLYDGFDVGLSYLWREGRENQPVSLVLDASNGDVAPPVEPYDDDQRTLNEFAASRTNGGTATYEDTTSTLDVPAIGSYSSSATINSRDDTSLMDYAGWQVHLGTVDDYRYPTVNFRFEEASNVLAGWLACAIGARMDLVNLSDVRVQQDPKNISLLLEGWSETINKFSWTATANCSPCDVWRVGVLAKDTGDAGEFLMHLESDGSTVVGYTAAGEASLTVATPSGPLWTTASDDFPFDLNVADVHVTVTAISGGSSPQTFTVNPTPFPIADGSQVSIWRPSVLAM
jgi:hypothetical protein